MTTTEQQASLGREMWRLYELSAEAEMMFDLSQGECTAETEALEDWLAQSGDATLQALCEFRSEIQGRLAAVKVEAERLKDAADRLNSKLDWAKARTVDVMKHLGVKSREVGTFAVSLLPGTDSVEIDANHPPDLSMLELEDPALVRRKEPELAPDKKAILAALKSGRAVPGFYKKTGPESVKIR